VPRAVGISGVIGGHRRGGVFEPGEPRAELDQLGLLLAGAGEQLLAAGDLVARRLERASDRGGVTA
jgi:hypothetical protein